MGVASLFTPAKLIIGLLSTHEEIHQSLFKRLEGIWGPIERKSRLHPFIYTSYYNEEMKAVPLRQYLIFKNLIDPSLLASIKIKTNEMEHDYIVDGGRSINLDPGVLTVENVMLATTKNRGHRIPLHDGIYGEVTLLYTQKTYIDFMWTYPDYKTDESKTFFLDVRKHYLKQLEEEFN